MAGPAGPPFARGPIAAMVAFDGRSSPRAARLRLPRAAAPPHARPPDELGEHARSAPQCPEASGGQHSVCASPSTFSAAEVGRHNRPADCWVVVRGRVYDVTAWVPRHPGGDLIFVKAGGDCTQLFDAYHPLAARWAAGPPSPERERCQRRGTRCEPNKQATRVLDRQLADTCPAFLKVAAAARQESSCKILHWHSRPRFGRRHFAAQL